MPVLNLYKELLIIVKVDQRECFLDKKFMIKQYTWLYKFAWSFEVVAAITGLAMALVFNAPAYIYYLRDGVLEATEVANLVGGALPFILIAFAELCKIPLVTATIKAKGVLITLLFGFTTCAAAFITFETVYNGLDTTQAQRSEVLFTYNAEIQASENRIENLTSRISLAKGYSQELLDGELSAKTSDINKAYDKRVSAINAEIKRINTQAADRQASVLKPLNEKIEQINERIREIKSSLGKSEQKRISSIEQIEAKINQARRRKSEYESKLLDCNFFSNACRTTNGGGVESAQEEVDSLESQLTKLTVVKSGSNSEVDGLIAGKAKITDQMTPVLQRIQVEKDKAFEKPNAERAEADTWLARNLAELEGKRKSGEKRVSSNQIDIDKLEGEKAAVLDVVGEIKKNKALEVNTNLVYRMAGKWYSVHASEVTDAQAGVVGMIWNGSIAMVVAIMGPMIAAAYIMLNSQRLSKPRSGLHSLALAIRSRKRKPVIIEKIVEVDKVVEKEVIVVKEVEVVVEKPIIKYVPLYTNDPDLIELAKGEYATANAASVDQKSSEGPTTEISDLDNYIKD
jgi:hypothetical protein